VEVKDDIGENANTFKSAAANATRPALKSMVVEWFFWWR
jgi:hypothetical protein